MIVKNLPVPLQKLVILRTKTQDKDNGYRKNISLSDEEILESDIMNLFEWSYTPDIEAMGSQFWSTINNMYYNLDHIAYAESIVGVEEKEPLIHF